MTEAAVRIPELEGSRVWFQPVDGVRVQAIVSEVWPGMGQVPGVNLTRVDSGDLLTSVPHISAVNGASGYFWSWGFGAEEASHAA